MKPTKATALAALILGAPSLLMAGDAVTTTTSTYTAPAPTQHQGWYLGGGLDYMFDSEEVLYTAHLGYDFGTGSSVFLEGGWMGEEQEPSFLFPFISADVDIVPVTVNFKQEFLFSDSFGAYIGAGLGATNVDVSAGAFGGDEWGFTAQIFAGLVYNVSPNFEIYGGLRYLWIDEVDVAGANIENLDDVGAGVGIRFNF